MREGVSIIVPAYNAEACIEGCLESLLALDYPRDSLEIIVVDNRSVDRTAEIIAAYPVIALREDVPGSAAARNRGLSRTTREIIAFTDADCEVAPDWVREIAHGFQDAQVDAMLGFTEGIDGNFWAQLEQKNFEAFWYRNTPDGRALRRAGIDTRNCALRAETLRATGRFSSDLAYCEDLELSVRLSAGGHRVILNERMRARHRNRTDLPHILSIKTRHAHAYLQVVARQSEGLDCPHLPTDVRRFLGVDNRTISGRPLAFARFGFRVLRVALTLALRLLERAGAPPRGLALRLFKTLCSVVWELVILDARRQRHALSRREAS